MRSDLTRLLLPDDSLIGILRANLDDFALIVPIVEKSSRWTQFMLREIDFNPVTRALVMAAEWDERGAEGIAYAKRLTRAALDRPLADGLADERRSFAAVMRTASAREGLRAGRAPASIQAL